MNEFESCLHAVCGVVSTHQLGFVPLNDVPVLSLVVLHNLFGALNIYVVGPVID